VLWLHVGASPSIWIPILSCANSLANSFEVNEARLGRSAISGCITIIGRWRRRCQIAREMEPLFLTVICGCNAGLLWEALHEVYIPRTTGKCLLCCERPWSQRSIAFSVNPFLRAWTLGVNCRNRCRGTKSHSGRSALHPHRVGIISNGHKRIGRLGYAKLLRARGVLVSFA
jgi:hypothetical protein